MKNYILSFFIFTFFSTLSCRPKEAIIPIEDPTKTTVNDPNASFLKSIIVEGASEVKINDSLGIIQVTLPANYTPTTINGELIFQKDAYWIGIGHDINYPANYSESKKFTLEYAGIDPINVLMSTKKNVNNYSKYYRIYVEHLGKPNVKLAFIHNSVSPDFSVFNKFDAISGIGTIPSNPKNQDNYVALFKKNGTSIYDTCILRSDMYANFRVKYQKYAPFENQFFTLAIAKNNQIQIVKDDIEFKREKTYASNFRYKVNDFRSIQINSTTGYFLPTDKYKLQLKNDFTPNIIEVNAETDVNDYRILNVKFAKSIPKGSYIFEVLENEKSISNKGIVNIIDSPSEKFIHKLWKRGNFENYIEPFEIRKTNYSRGDTLSIVSGLILYSAVFKQEDIPVLRISKDNKSFELQPTVQIYHWTVALTSLKGFDYTIPKDLEIGDYEIQLVFPNGELSLKYWNKIGIK
jgi:hypothetical protein